MTAADLARIVHASRSGRRNGQLMPSFGPNRNRQSAHDIALRLRLERTLAVTTSGVLRDDVLVAELVARSIVAADGEAAHVRVVVEVIAPMPLIPWPEKVRAKVAPTAHRLL